MSFVEKSIIRGKQKRKSDEKRSILNRDSECESVSDFRSDKVF